MAERKHIKVNEVLEPRKVGERGTQLYEIKGDDGTKYGCFSSTLATYFIKDSTIDAEVETTEKTGADGTIYKNHRIVQIYVNGNPVSLSGDKQRGKFYGKSPAETASIENQCKSKIVSDLWIAGKFNDNHPRVIALNKWLEYSTVKQETVSTESKPIVKTIETNPTDTVPQINPETLKLIHAAQIEVSITNRQLVDECKTRGWNIQKGEDLKQPQAARLLEWLNAKKIPF